MTGSSLVVGTSARRTASTSQTGCARRLSVRQIAAELGRSPRPSAARYAATRPCPGAATTGPSPPRPGPMTAGPPEAGKIGQNPELRDFVQDHLHDAVEPGADLPGSA